MIEDRHANEGRWKLVPSLPLDACHLSCTMPMICVHPLTRLANQYWYDLCMMLQLVGRIGLLATLWSYVSNQLLVDDLGPHEALADMIVVAPQARGRGIGVALMRWCEAAAVAEFPTEPHVKLHLWVSAPSAVY